MYGLEPGDRYEIKRIAGTIYSNIIYWFISWFLGRIVPAIGTTTATVSGLVSFSPPGHIICLTVWCIDYDWTCEIMS